MTFDLSAWLLLAAQPPAAPSPEAVGTVASAFIGVILGLAVVIGVVVIGHLFWAAKRSRGELTDADDAVKNLGDSSPPFEKGGKRRLI